MTKIKLCLYSMPTKMYKDIYINESSGIYHMKLSTDPPHAFQVSIQKASSLVTVS